MHRILRTVLAVLLSLPMSLLVAGSSPAAPLYPVAAAHLSPGGAAFGVRTAEAPFTFTMVGVTYRGRPQDMLMRARGGGGWSAWTPLASDSDEGPDAGSPERSAISGSRPVWTGAAREIQIRVRDPASVSHLTVHFLDATGRALRPAGRLAALLRPGLAGRLAAAASKPAVVSRAEWGADEGLRTCGPFYASELKGAFIHHTAGRNDYSATDSPAIVRSIYWYHTQVRGWCDIGYNFLVDRFATIFEGRFGGIDRPVVGAHTGGFNTGSTGIALMGNFVDADPPSAGVDSIVRLLGWKFTVHRVFPRAATTYVSGGSNKYPPGASVTLPTIAGHRDADATACPARLYDQLSGIRARVVADFQHPEGTLIKGSPPAVFLVERGAKRIIPSPGVLESRFRWSEIVPVTDDALRLYSDGPVLGYRDGSLIRTPDGTVWIISEGRRRGFTSLDAFHGLGYSMSNVREVPWEEASIHAEGIPVANPTGPHPPGTLINGSGPTVYYLEGAFKRGIPSPGAFDSRFRWGEIVSVSDSEVAGYVEAAPLGYRDGSLIATSDGTVWTVAGGLRRGFTSPDVFIGLNYSFSNIRWVTWEEASYHPEDATV